MLPRLYRLLLALAGLVAVAALGWYLTRPKPLDVALASVERGTVQATISNTRAGTVKACRRSRLAPATGGQVARLPVKEGDRVKAGQLLLAIWNDDLQAKVQLALSRATEAQARQQEVCLRAEQGKREAVRQAHLLRQKLVSEEQADRADTEAQASEAACRAGAAAAEVAQAQATVARAELERTQLRAPFGGIVAQINGELGEYITPSPPGIPTLPAVDLIDDSCLYVSAPIDEVDAPSVRLGMPVCVSLDAFSGKRCSGRVRRIAPYVLDREKQARTVDVEVDFADPDDTRGLLAGYSADVEIVRETRNDVLRVPTQAVLQDYHVLVYRQADGKLEDRHFKPGIANWQYTEVLSGLHSGERVTLSVDREGVKAGALVRSETASASADAP